MSDSDKDKQSQRATNPRNATLNRGATLLSVKMLDPTVPAVQLKKIITFGHFYCEASEAELGFGVHPMCLKVIRTSFKRHLKIAYEDSGVGQDVETLWANTFVPHAASTKPQETQSRATEHATLTRNLKQADSAARDNFNCKTCAVASLTPLVA